MDEAEFDKVADEYSSMLAASVALSGEDPSYFAEYKIRDIAKEYAKLDGEVNVAPNILDFGSGIGGSVPYVRKYFPKAQLTCIDVSRRSLAIAEGRFPRMARYVHFDGTKIPLPSDSFDLAYAACVFHHIDHAEHVALLRELRRVLRPTGSLFVYEHNPYNPLTVRVVNKCEFDKNARLIRGRAMKSRFSDAGFANAAVRYRVFFPHALNALRPLESALAWLPLGGQYYVLARK